MKTDKAVAVEMRHRLLNHKPVFVGCFTKKESWKESWEFIPITLTAYKESPRMYKTFVRTI